MELHQLRYFVAVADLGNFTRAAERCLVAQPSLSQQIQKLERELGRPLFERLGRSVRLTEAGRMLYAHAVSILASVEDARRRVSEESGTGRVVVGAIPTVAPYLLPPLIQRFKQDCPEAEITVHEDLTEHVVQESLRGELDVAVVALPIDEERLHVESLFTEELLLAMPAGHPLVEKRRITMQDIDGEAFVLLNEVHCLGEQIVRFCRQQSCTPAISCRSAQLLTVQEFVALGHGLSLIPQMARATDRSDSRVYRSLADNKPERTLAMIWHKQRYQSPLVQQFIETLRGEAGRHGRTD